jgi:2-iminobutanoate/2-iminopropanoate deaminase
MRFDNPAAAPAPASPLYSQLARLELAGTTLLFVSGQIAVDDQGRLVGEDSMTEQSERVFEIIGAILGAHGGSLADIVNIRTFVTDMSRLREYGAVRAAALPGEPPTSTTVEVSALFFPGALLEVEVIAAV